MFVYIWFSLVDPGGATAPRASSVLADPSSRCFFSSDSPPPERRHKVLRRAQRRAQGLLRRSSVHGELAWNRLVHSVLAKGPLRSRNLIKALAVCVAAVGATAAGIEVGWPQEAAYMAGIFVAAALLWVTEALPLFATALLVVGFEILLLANPGGWSGLGFAQAPRPTTVRFWPRRPTPFSPSSSGAFCWRGPA